MTYEELEKDVNDTEEYKDDGEIDFFAANPVEAKEWYLGNRFGGEQNEYTLFIEKTQGRYFNAYIRIKSYTTFSYEIGIGDPESFEEAFENAMAVVKKGKCFEQVDDMLRHVDAMEFGYNFVQYKNETYGPTYAFWDTERQLAIGISGEEKEADREVFIWKNGMHNRLRIAHFDAWDDELGEHFSKSTPEIMAIVDGLLETKAEELIKKLEEINKEDLSVEIPRYVERYPKAVIDAIEDIWSDSIIEEIAEEKELLQEIYCDGQFDVQSDEAYELMQKFQEGFNYFFNTVRENTDDISIELCDRIMKDFEYENGSPYLEDGCYVVAAMANCLKALLIDQEAKRAKGTR